jgi:large subunit ribosomal protein L9
VHDLEEAQQIKGRLETEPVNVGVRAGESGRLFGAVTVSDIADALAATGVTVDKRRIEVGNPIKTLGAHEVAVRVHPEVRAQVRLNVVASK